MNKKKRKSLGSSQVFLPIAGIDGDMIEAYRGTVFLPFEVGGNGGVAVKIVDDLGVEGLKVVEIEAKKLK